MTLVPFAHPYRKFASEDARIFVVTATGGNEHLPDRVLATEADRDEVVARLNEAIGKGALELTEVEERLAAVYRARTRSDLASITADLPTPAPAVPKPSPWDGFRSATFQSHLACYVVVIAFLIGIWAVSGGGHFWPFYPAGGWGIGLVMHYMAVTRARHIAARRRARNAARDSRRDGRSHRRQVHRSSSAALPRSSRRFVVAMFVDVVGSTGLNEAMGDEQWAAERARFRSLVGDCARAEGGWEVNAAGDGVLTRFDAPAAAVRAATALQRALAKRRAESFAPRIRVGIHSGDVIDEGDDIVGSVINVASRVGDLAAADEIVITEHVADHVDDLVTVDRGLHELRGVSQPRHLLELRWSDLP